MVFYIIPSARAYFAENGLFLEKEKSLRIEIQLFSYLLRSAGVPDGATDRRISSLFFRGVGGITGRRKFLVAEHVDFKSDRRGVRAAGVSTILNEVDRKCEYTTIRK